MYVVKERFPGELQTLRADNVRLRRLLALSGVSLLFACNIFRVLTGSVGNHAHANGIVVAA